MKIFIKFTKHVQPHEQEYFRIFNIAIKRYDLIRSQTNNTT